MKIRFMLLNAYARSGIVKTTYTLAGNLARLGHEVEIVSLYRQRREPPYAVPKRVRVWALYDKYALEKEPETLSRRRRMLLSRLRKRTGRPTTLVPPGDVRRRSYNAASDFLMERYLRSLRDGVIVGARPGINLVIAELVSDRVVKVGQEHGTWDRHNEELRQAIVERYPKLDLLTSLTHPDSAEYRAVLGDRLRVERIPNAAPRPSGRKRTVRQHAVISAGRVVPQKGFHHLIASFTAAAATRPGWELHIYGHLRVVPEYVEQLRTQIRDLGMEDRIFLDGFTKRLQKKMVRNAIFALTSRREGFPMVLLEAMSCGMAVVSYDCPHGPADAIDDGVNGRLVPHMDIDALTVALGDLMDDEAARARMGEAARATIKSYRPKAIARDFERLLLETAAAKGIAVSPPRPRPKKGRKRRATT